MRQMHFILFVLSLWLLGSIATADDCPREHKFQLLQQNSPWTPTLIEWLANDPAYANVDSNTSKYINISHVGTEGADWFLAAMEDSEEPKRHFCFLIKSTDDTNQIWPFVVNTSGLSIASVGDSRLYFWQARPIIGIATRGGIHHHYDFAMQFWSLQENSMTFLKRVSEWYQDSDEYHGLYDGDGHKTDIQYIRCNENALRFKMTTNSSWLNGLEGGGIKNSQTVIYRLNHEGMKMESEIEPFQISHADAKKTIDKLFEWYYEGDQAEAPDEKVQWARYFLRSFRNLQTLAPEFAPGYYNAACMLAIMGKADEALPQLEKAFQLDPKYKTKAQKDGDLMGVRELEGFQVLMGNQ